MLKVPALVTWFTKIRSTAFWMEAPVELVGRGEKSNCRKLREFVETVRK
jgi:hypothetical protein